MSKAYNPKTGQYEVEREQFDDLTEKWNRQASARKQAGPANDNEPGAAQIGMRDRKYVDSTPHLHVGNSAFEDWYQQYPKACVGDKQLARDAYAAGMGDPLVMARDAAQQQVEFEAFASNHGMLLHRAADCSSGSSTRFGIPLATYYEDFTEGAWRAWANKPAAQQQDEPQEPHVCRIEVQDGKIVSYAFQQLHGAWADGEHLLCRASTQQAEPALVQMRMRPMWREEGGGWTEWGNITEAAAQDYERHPIYQDWQYEVRRFYLGAQPGQQGETGADERAAFEDWMRANRYDVGTFAWGEYHNMFARNAWMGWQARAAQPGQRAGVAEGWKLVPVELTDEMRQAAYDAFIAQSKKRNGLVEAYRAAIAAAPTPAAQEGEQP